MGPTFLKLTSLRLPKKLPKVTLIFLKSTRKVKQYLATESDPLCKRLFEEAGKGLAQYLVAISRNFDDQMFENVPLLIVGSVFQSWNIMRNSKSRALYF